MKIRAQHTWANRETLTNRGGAAPDPSCSVRMRVTWKNSWSRHQDGPNIGLFLEVNNEALLQIFWGTGSKLLLFKLGVLVEKQCGLFYPNYIFPNVPKSWSQISFKGRFFQHALILFTSLTNPGRSMTS